MVFHKKEIELNRNTKITFFKYVVQNKLLYIFILIGLVYLFIFNYLPMLGIVMAFENFSPVKGITGSDWVGFQNFIDLFNSRDFRNVFLNSVLLSVYRIFWGFPAPIIIALLLNEVRKMMFKRAIQTIIYIPHFISWVVLGSIVINFLSPSKGLVNDFIGLFGITPISFLTDTNWFRSSLVFSEIYKEMGWGTIIYLAAISGIDPGLYDAAMIDGANRFKRMLYITFPGISTTIIVMLVLRLGSILRNGFEQVYLLYNPLVYSVADVFETYAYRTGLLQGRFSYATAVGLFQSVVGLVFIILSNTISRKISNKGLW